MIRRHHQIYIWEERETFVVNNLLQRNGSTDDMPTSIELFLESFFDMFCCIFQIGYLSFDHLVVHVLGNQKCIVFHF